jgi:hypothetical protein
VVSGSMRNMQRSRLRFWLLRLSFVPLVGCNSDIMIPVPSSDEPLLYLVLGDPPMNPSSGQPDTLLYALLATTGTPIDSRPRSATRFDMRESISGASYDWRPIVPLHSLQYGEEDLGSIAGIANYALPWSSGPSGRGTVDLIYGATYTLDIETEGIKIHGFTTLPARFDITVSTTNGERIASWPHVMGAAGYFVSVRQPGGIIGTLSVGRATVDTLFAIPAEFGSGDSVTVDARDANYVAAREDQAAGTRRGRVGIDRGFGVFAAVTRSTTVLP